MKEDIVNITYQQTGQSTNTDALGMRDMQAKVYAVRDKQYLLVKAPPASGKSRAMMFVALYKINVFRLCLVSHIRAGKPDQLLSAAGKYLCQSDISRFSIFLYLKVEQR